MKQQKKTGGEVKTHPQQPRIPRSQSITVNQLREMLSSTSANERKTAAAHLSVHPARELGRELLAALQKEEDWKTACEMANAVSAYGNSTIMAKDFYVEAGRVLLDKFAGTSSLELARTLLNAISHSSHASMFGDAITAILEKKRQIPDLLQGETALEANRRISEGYVAYCFYG